MIILHLHSVVLELVEMYNLPYYWKQYENWGQWIVNLTLIMVWIVSIIPKQSDINFNPGVLVVSKLDKLGDGDSGSGEDRGIEEIPLGVFGWIWEIFLPTIYFVSLCKIVPRCPLFNLFLF